MLREPRVRRLRDQDNVSPCPASPPMSPHTRDYSPPARPSSMRNSPESPTKKHKPAPPEILDTTTTLPRAALDELAARPPARPSAEPHTPQLCASLAEALPKTPGSPFQVPGSPVTPATSGELNNTTSAPDGSSKGSTATATSSSETASHTPGRAPSGAVVLEPTRKATATVAAPLVSSRSSDVASKSARDVVHAAESGEEAQVDGAVADPHMTLSTAVEEEPYILVPGTRKPSEDIRLHGVGQVGVASDPNMKYRHSDEDAAVICQRLVQESKYFSGPSAFVAVYDGHGGDAASHAAAEDLHGKIRDRINRGASPSNAMNQSYAELDGELRQARMFTTGSTAVTCLFHEAVLPTRVPSGQSDVAAPVATLNQFALTSVTHESDTEVSADGDSISSEDDVTSEDSDRANMRSHVRIDAKSSASLDVPVVTPRYRRRLALTTANVGDARAVLCRGGHAVRLTVDHRAADAAERARIEKGGGFVCARRVNGILEVSRALGDHSLKSVVVPSPALREVVLGEADEFVIIACDGLWDWIDDDTAVGFASDMFDGGETATQVAQGLVSRALKAGSTDNITVSVVKFDER